MTTIRGSGNGRLRREDEERLYDVSYAYELREDTSGGRPKLFGKLPTVDWKLGQTLHGRVCILYLEDGLPRYINVYMANPFSDCTFTSAPGGEDWPGVRT